MTVVEVLVLKGSMPSSIAITLDLLAAANRMRIAAGRSPVFEIRLAGSGVAQARAIAGLPRGTAANAKTADVIVMPGLGMSTEEDVQHRLKKHDAIQARQRLTEAAARGAEIATACSGTFLFAAAGLLDHRRATTTWWLAPLFRRLYPKVHLETDALVVTDKKVTTAGAAMAQLDLMLSIIARYGGAKLAGRCARYLLLDERRSQARYMALGFLAAADEQVARAEVWARKRLETDFSVNDVAAAVGLSPRTFSRRVERATGLSPVRFLRRLRVERAVELIESTKLPFEEIARRVGYAEPTTLRRALRCEAGRTARDLRQDRAAAVR